MRDNGNTIAQGVCLNHQVRRDDHTAIVGSERADQRPDGRSGRRIQAEWKLEDKAKDNENGNFTIAKGIRCFKPTHPVVGSFKITTA
jgi:hypothetical protein